MYKYFISSLSFFLFPLFFLPLLFVFSMRLICVPNLTIFIFTIFTLSHITFAQDLSINAVDPQADSQNIDDTSLFRGVESTMDEEGDDADRILKSLQDTSADDFSEDDDQEDEEEEQVVHHSSSKDIKQRIQPDEGEVEDDTDIEIDDDVDIGEDEDEEEEEEDENEDDEEEDYDFPADSFPDFRNEETSKFFDHLPQQISSTEKETLTAEEEEDDDKVDNNEEDEEDEVENMNNEKTTNINNNNNDIPPIDTIPWHKSDPLEKVVIDDDKFYQEGNMNYGNEYKTSLAEFKLWHGMSILLVLAIIYKWVNKKSKVKKPLLPA